jgi:hypothetical protein
MDYGKQSFVDPADRLRLHKLNPARGSLCWRWLPVSSSWCCACAVRDDSAIALQDPDFLDPGAELVGNDLRERGLEPLAVGGNPETAGHRSRRVEADRRRLGPGVDRHARRCRDARSDPRQFSVSSNADPGQPPLGAGLRLLLPELSAGRHLMGEFLWSDQVAEAELGGIDCEPPRRAMDGEF